MMHRQRRGWPGGFTAFAAFVTLLLIPTVAQAAPRPRILAAHFTDRVIAAVPATLEVRVQDPFGAINGLRVDFGDGTHFSESACRPLRAGLAVPDAFKPNKPITITIPTTYAAGGSYTVNVTAMAGACDGGFVMSQDARKVQVAGLPPKGHIAQALTPAPLCGADTVIPGQVAGADLAASLLCLVNQVRRANKLVPLKRVKRIELAARRHAADMVARGYFGHNSPSGATVIDRLRAAHYKIRGATGENLAAGTNQFGSPLGTLLAWLDSPPHKANLLDPDFRRAGLAVAPGIPGEQADAAATYVLDFAAR